MILRLQQTCKQQGIQVTGVNTPHMYAMNLRFIECGMAIRSVYALSREEHEFRMTLATMRVPVYARLMSA